MDEKKEERTDSVAGGKESMVVSCREDEDDELDARRLVHCLFSITLDARRSAPCFLGV